MDENIAPLITSQVPEYLRENSPLFSAFMTTYYEYASQKDKAVGLVQNRNQNTDIDHSDDAYINQFYLTYGKYLPASLALDRRNFIKLLNTVYQAKGTEKALSLLFRVVFNEEISVTYPEHNSLRASDGVWTQDRFVTLVTVFGAVPSPHSFLSFSNSLGDFSFEISDTEIISSTDTRIFFKSSAVANFVDSQLVNQYDNTGTLLYTGKLRKSPASVSIVSPGASWVVGQVITIPGTIRNTIGRVTGVNSTGGITNIDILEYGYLHDPYQVVTVAPYDSRPVSATVIPVSTMYTFSPLVYHHTLDIHDHVYGFDEVVTGSFNSTQYGVSTFGQTSKQSAPLYNADTLGLTLGTYLSSRVVLSINFANVVKTKGYYATEAGQISNQSIRMHDNYFYQAFSYLIETARDIREYRQLLNITHPAGTKLFATLAKVASYLMTYDFSRTLSIDTLYLLDVANAIDTITKYLNRSINETYTITETYGNSLNKGLISDSVTFDSLNTTSVVVTTYASADYFAEVFVANSYTLSIG